MPIIFNDLATGRHGTQCYSRFVDFRHPALLPGGASRKQR